MKAHLRHLVSAILALGLAGSAGASGAPPAAPDPSLRPAGVCPPFHLRDEQGATIDPVAGVNAKVRYSPRQTCGATGCHDYERITRGYHFTQGQGEAPTHGTAEVPSCLADCASIAGWHEPDSPAAPR
jgi:hypothetical protein